MIKEIKGSILDTHCKLIAHGCNAQGVMGSGVARILYDKWPMVKSRYLYFVNVLNKNIDPDHLLGMVDFEWVDIDIEVANCFTQQNCGTDKQVYLSYAALNDCFQRLKDHAIENKITEIAMPKIGCGLAGGDWERVKVMLEDKFKDTEIIVYVYSLD